jgi:bifunctional UDP-N-acetylglucosamine pyrophosphorylase/glucosamine-1-phosphate N-acetyltransferase
MRKGYLNLLLFDISIHFNAKKKNVQKSTCHGNMGPMKNPWTVIILAAGRGTRMNSGLPKVLHPVAGRPMISHIIGACHKAGLTDIRLVAGFGLNMVKTVVEPFGVQIYTQAEQKGTADAVKAAHPDSLEGNVIILNGDHPLIQADDLLRFQKEFLESKADLLLVTTKLKDPKMFGRVVRQSGKIKAVVEAKDASADTLKINEINTGIYIVKADLLKEELPHIESHNSQSEYYLTDLLSIAIEGQNKVDTIEGHPRVAFGVNTQRELAKATRWHFRSKARDLMDAGVVILDPKSVYIEPAVTIGAGSVIYPNVMIRGSSSLGAFCAVEPSCYIVDSQIGDSVQIRAGSYLEQVKVSSKASLGPYARLRPETEIGEGAHVGNFVEMKKVKFGAKSKAGHLTYLGDAEIGAEVNIGCGTITCNYAPDKSKYKTKIGDRVFVGSDTQFVAPISIGADAIIGSGSTITKDVPARALAVARGRQVTKENYVKPEAEEEKDK